MPSQSLLQSRDEVFKEIEDSGEDVAISPLHLFQGDMDLPPLSFHSSLEEQWDEEEEPEEIEAVLKVVPPAYHQFTSLTSLLKRDSPFIFNEEGLGQFQILKEEFTTAPILSHFNPSLPTIVETDASEYALGAVLSQGGHSTRCLVTLGQCVPREGGELHQEESSKFSSSNQARWDSRIKVVILSDLVEQMQKEVWQDKDYKEILKKLARGESVSDYSLEPQAKLLLFKDRVVVPSNEEIQLNILQKHHDSLLAGHPCQEKTLKLIRRDFYWASMNQFIKDYVSSCQQCSRNKNSHHKKSGLLMPLQILSVPWSSLSLDFITQLPLSNNFD
ncbi:hypothetical protein O181_010041 [Austropuccinia psidii MF-1]|uniref:Integrase zinc-binding domain-containing protein n=1 Tax=Austropuccinia psidii MF-1 TaxID=1389203 RepID=A0A9Q3BQA4_9BASI|nr:hypothetical protein [Austropuccinia psidii MF-1]